jgi:hypothetical protein
MLPTPTYPQYTNLALSEGLFDQLMTSIRSHLDKEYKEQRIRGAEYSKVFLGSLEAALGNTTQYLLGVLLIEERKLNLDLQNAILELQREELRFKIDFLYPLEVQKLQAEVLMMNKQIEKIDKEIEYLTAKIATEIANVDATGVNPVSVIGRQIELLRAQKLGFAGDLESKAARLHAEYAGIFQTVQEVPEDVALNPHSLTAINYILQTVEKIKDESYTDVPFTPFTPP